MYNPKLNYRLLKLAADALNPIADASNSNEEFGANFARHFQHLGAIDPASPAGRAYMQQHNIPLETAQWFHNEGNNLGGYFREHWQSLMQQLESQGMGPSTLASMAPIAQLRHRARAELNPANQYRLYSRTPSGRRVGTGQAIWGGLTGNIPNEDQAMNELQSQMISGAMPLLDRNSPTFRKLIAEAGTGYLRGKIDEWLPRTSNWGQAANSFGNFALGLASMTPGYETAMNWMADFKYGDRLNPNPPKPQTATQSAPDPNSPDSPNTPTPSQTRAKAPATN